MKTNQMNKSQMKPNQLKQSQKALLGVIGTLAILVFASVPLSRGSSYAEEHSDYEGMSSNTELTGFNEIDIQGDWQIKVTQGDDWQVRWFDPDEGPNSESGKDSVKVFVSGDTLKLKRRKAGNWWQGHSPTLMAEIMMPELNEMDIAGAAEIELSGFEGDKLDIDIAGAVELTGVDGYYDELELDSAGASEIDLRGITIKDVDVDIAGASEVTLSMGGGKLSGSIAGAGEILYYGDVSEEDVDIAGFATVDKAD